MAKFIEKESMKHFLAKKTLKNWLQQAENNSTTECGCCEFAQFTWQKSHGVYDEFKIYENDENYYLEFTDWDEYDRGKIIFIPDIIVFHKGMVNYVFEVVHTSPISDEKRQKMIDFFGEYTSCYEIEAEHILSFDKNIIPKKLTCTKIF